MKDLISVFWKTKLCCLLLAFINRQFENIAIIFARSIAPFPEKASNKYHFKIIKRLLSIKIFMMCFTQ